MKKILFVYNPTAGTHCVAAKLDYIVQRFQNAGVLVQLFRFIHEETQALIDTLRQNDFSYVLISGGDGTLNTVANILLDHLFPMPIGIIPSGTCNDFARSLGLPSSLEKCVDVVLAGKTMHIDIGLINKQKYFLSTCAGGLFVNIPMDTHNELKKRLGPFAYYLKALSEVVNIKSFHLKLKTEAQTIEENVLLFLILNGKHGAGFSNVIREAELSDGIMDILLIKHCSHIDLAALAIKVLQNDLVNDKHIVKIRTQACTIESSRKIVSSVDGETGPPLPFEIEFLPRKLEIFVP
ncbi:MAG: YegS/Rv2252/BmrU family lipid kinase [Firmicutes bacterium]|nr:YegS/Rv2252/BmrU family lipid kinase [Bacillota bacterium]